MLKPTTAQHRIVIFGAHSYFISNYLVEALLRIIKSRDDVQACLIVLTDRKLPRRSTIISTIVFFVREAMLKLFNRDHVVRVNKYWRSNLRQVGAQYGISVISPKGQDINSEAFLEGLTGWRPTVGFSLVCPQIMRRKLIDLCGRIVNYHNGFLSGYRGVYSTEWSIYNRERQTGFAFHLIDDGIDSGPVLSEGAVAILEDRSTIDIEVEKTKKATEGLHEVVELALGTAADLPVATSKGAYYGLSETEKLLTIDCAALLPADEILRRLRIFGHLNVKIADTLIANVTALREERCAGRLRLSFATRDSKVLRIYRISGRPVWLAKVLGPVSRGARAFFYRLDGLFS
jgi:methionyl-tRNA formyltransferase